MCALIFLEFRKGRKLQMLINKTTYKDPKRNKKEKRKKGFTLAELLIVVAILAVMTAIAVPLFIGALDNAKKAVFESNQRAIKTMGVAMLLSDDDVDFERNTVFYAYAIIQDGKIGPVTIVSEEKFARERMAGYCVDTYEKWATWYGDWDGCIIMAKITADDLEFAEEAPESQ